MTEPLTLDRFRMLADAYGGAVERWPERHRKAAARLGVTVEGAAILERASALDVDLDAWRVPAPATILSARIVSSAPAAARKRTTARWLWWSGIGVSATLAGAVAGSAAVAMVAPVETMSSSTAFGDVVGSVG